jgi:amino acid adenylation domain-containing protein
MSHATAEGAYVFPASFAQRRLWFIEQIEDLAGAYNVSFALRFRGELDCPRMAEALSYLENRHEVLRTTFAMERGALTQVVRPPIPFPLRIEELVASGEPTDTALNRWLQCEVVAPFDLGTGPLIRAAILRTSRQEHVLVITMHHSIVDAWSIPILVRDLAAAYAGIGDGREPTLEPLPIQYADYAVWQIDGLTGEALERKLAYWKRQLAGPLPVLELPTDHPRPPTQTYNGDRVSVDITPKIAASIGRLARESNATLFMALLTTFQVFLHRHSGQTDLVIGTPITGRNQAETAGLIGFFLNTLAIRSDLSGNPSFREALTRVRRTVLDAYAEQDLPFEKLVEALQAPRDWSRHPLFQAVFVLHELPGELPEFPGLTVERLPMPKGSTSKFDLLLSVSQTGTALRAEFEYNTDLFDRETAQLMAARYRVLLGSIAADPDTGIGTLPLLPEEERRRVQEAWTGTSSPYPRNATITQLFEEQARATPDAPAVAGGKVVWSYAQLDERANRLAHHLRSMGVERGTPVGVCLERSPEMVVGLLGILKAGGAYVPLDPNYPVARLAIMAEEAGIRAVVTRQSLVGTLPRALRAGAIVRMDADWPSVAQRSATPLDLEAGPTDLAYVMFTSGSTGRPKGVAIPHRGIVRLVKNTDFVGPDAYTRVLCYAPISFDASTFELWGPLLNGGTAVVFPAHAPTLAELGSFIAREQVSTVWLTAALFHQMVEAELPRFSQVKYLLAGGDVLSPSHVARVLARFPGCHMINGYGPTENTTFTCCHRITRVEPDTGIPIGRPIANTRVYLLDPWSGPAPIGVPGELFAGGDGLALGYCNQPELTATHFVERSVRPDGAERLYRTGDRARWRRDGTIEFLGRLDDQVKIRGYRIELDEVRSALEEHPAVGQAAVVVRGDLSEARAVVGYYVPRAGIEVSEADLRQALRLRLPPYMMPAALIRVPALPLTAAGKLDRDALPVAELQAGEPADDGGQPRSTIELALISLWESMLDRRPIGVADDFFDLGGHSLLAARMVDELQRATGLTLPLAALFKGATIADIADYLVENPGDKDSTRVIEVQRGSGDSPFFMLHGDLAGGGFYCREIARAVGPDQPVYSLAPHRETDVTGALTIESMAARHLATIRTIQPHGPYWLGGYCISGLVALEIAQQLTAAGESVALLTLVDTAPAYTRPRWLAPAMRLVSRLTTKGEQAYLDRLAYLMRRARAGRGSARGRQLLDLTALPFQAVARRVARLTRAPGAAVPGSGPLATPLSSLWNLHRRAMLTYTPRRYSGRVDLIWSSEIDDSLGDPAPYWQSVAGHLVTVKVPGTHVGVILTQVPSLVRAAIARVLTGPA